MSVMPVQCLCPPPTPHPVIGASALTVMLRRATMTHKDISEGAK